MSLERGSELLDDPEMFFCGLFVTNRPVVVQSLAKAISSIWRLKDKVVLHESPVDSFVRLFVVYSI